MLVLLASKEAMQVEGNIVRVFTYGRSPLFVAAWIQSSQQNIALAFDDKVITGRRVHHLIRKPTFLVYIPADDLYIFCTQLPKLIQC